METKKPTAEEKEKDGEASSPGRWWFKNVIIPLIAIVLGTGGVAAFLAKRDPDKPIPVSNPGIAFNNSNNNEVVGHDKITNVNNTAEVPPQPVNREIVMYEDDTRTVQGIVIHTNSIYEIPDGPTVAELSISDGGIAKVPTQRVTKGDLFGIRKDKGDKLTVSVVKVEQFPTDPDMSWDELKQLGVLGVGLITKKITLLVSGEAKVLDSPDEIKKDNARVEEEKLKRNFMVKVPILGSVDARDIPEEHWPTQFIGGIVDNNWHTLKTFIELGVDINTTSGGDGNTALIDALLYNRIEMFKFLLKKGADPDVVGKGGKTVRDMLSNRPDKKEFSDALQQYSKKQ